MDRKEFLKTSCTGVCAAIGSGFLMSALVSACKTPLGVIKTASKNNFVSIPLTEFVANSYKIVRVSNYNYDLAIQKQPDGTYQTLVLKCTHASQPLTKTGDKYYCTLHGSQFSHDGTVMKGPAERNMFQLPTQVVGDNLSIHLNQSL